MVMSLAEADRLWVLIADSWQSVCVEFARWVIAS